MEKRVLALILAACMLVLPGCGTVRGNDEEDTWAIYWYLCGSNLESFYSCATNDIAEMLDVKLPENIKVIVETGGAYQWHNDNVSADKIQRHIIDSSGMHLIEEHPAQSMGAQETLASFLTFCKENYPAEHTVMLFWDHGGGSVAGASFDEVYGYDSLTLNEFAGAFREVYELDGEKPPFELVGFDTCLMATVDVAYTFRNIARYMVASEELEPANGWDYTGWMTELVNDPEMDGAELGKAICDAYISCCEKLGTDDEITLSVTDLSGLNSLMDAYDAWENEALITAVGAPTFFGALGRKAQRTESYGGNNPSEGYTNMVDLGDLVRNCTDILPKSADTVLKALDECIIYQVKGPCRQEATGLSCFHSYSADIENFVDYTEVGVSEPSKYLYAYAISGRLSGTGEEYVRGLGYDPGELEKVNTIFDFNITDHMDISVNDSGWPVMTLTTEVTSTLKSVTTHVLSYHEYEDGSTLAVDWGQCSDMERDWNGGKFTSLFNGDWVVVDGTDSVLPTNLLFSGEEYDLYYLEVLYNGETRYLHICRDNKTGEYRFLGLREGIDPETGMGDKNYTLLKPGDEITPCYRVTEDIFADSIEWHTVPLEEFSFIYGDDTAAVSADFTGSEQTEFLIMFELTDTVNNTAYSGSFLQIYGGDQVGTMTMDEVFAGTDTMVIRER